MQSAISFTSAESASMIEFFEACHGFISRNDLVFSVYPKLRALLPHARFSCSVGSTEGVPAVLNVNINLPDSKAWRILVSGQCMTGPLVQEWLKTRQPVFLDTTSQSPAGADGLWQRAFRTCGVNNVAAHGVLDQHGGVSSFFVFAGMDAWGRRQEFMLRLLTPHLHVAAGGISRVTCDTHQVQLSLREKEMLEWICVGKSNPEIAGIVGISPWTVKIHVSNMMNKLQASSRSQAVARAYQMGIIGRR